MIPLKPSRRWAILVVAIIGIAVLFTFPEPSENLFGYIATMIAFGIMIIALSLEKKQ